MDCYNITVEARLDTISISAEKVLESLFSSSSRVIPPHGFESRVKDENDSFHLEQIGDGDEDDCLSRMREYLPEYTFPSLIEFQDKCGAVKKKALEHPQIGPNAFNRCNLPLPIPHIPELADPNQLGQVLEDLLEAVGRVCENEFNNPLRKFSNYYKGVLIGETHIVPCVRHKEALIAVANAPQAGILLPNSLRGYSIDADRAIISLFPDFVSLVGIEYVIAMIGYPYILARNRDTPGLDLAALSGRYSDSSFFFRANDAWFTFIRTCGLTDAHDDYSGGLMFW